MAAGQEPELSGALRLTDLRHVLDVVVEQAYGGLRQLADSLPSEPDAERCARRRARPPRCRAEPGRGPAPCGEGACRRSLGKHSALGLRQLPDRPRREPDAATSRVLSLCGTTALSARTGKRWLAGARALTAQQGRACVACGTRAAERGPGCARRPAVAACPGRARGAGRRRAGAARRTAARRPGPLSPAAARARSAPALPVTGPAPRAGSARCWRTCTAPSSACCACSWSRSGPTRRAAHSAHPVAAGRTTGAAGRGAARRRARCPAAAAGRRLLYVLRPGLSSLCAGGAWGCRAGTSGDSCLRWLRPRRTLR